MPVPTLITQLDTAAANNSPPGTESARGNIDDYLRAHASFIRQVFNGAQSGSYAWAGTAGGAANALTLTVTPAITAYSAGQRFVFKSGASANSGVTTVAVSGLTPLAVQVNGAACAGGEIAANNWYEVLVDASLTSCQLNKIGQATGLRSTTTFTASGTYAKPTGLQSVRVRMVGGGGGSNTTRAGGGGGYAEKLILASAIGATETVTVGAAGGPLGTSTGGTSSFGSHFTTTGGNDGGKAVSPGAGGNSTGTVTIGIGGRSSTATSGGDSSLGFGGTSTSPTPTGYGAGGGTDGATSISGTAGIVIVEEYF